MARTTVLAGRNWCPWPTVRNRKNPLRSAGWRTLGGRGIVAAFHRTGVLRLLVARDVSASSASVPLVDTSADIELAAQKLAETAGSPVRVILFGSHARNEAGSGSDLDFLVIEPNVLDRHAEMVRLRSALHDLRRPIDVLVYSDAQVEEWGDAPGTALHTALTEGRVLVEA